jgi:hypothetical protein
MAVFPVVVLFADENAVEVYRERGFKKLLYGGVLGFWPSALGRHV